MTYDYVKYDSLALSKQVEVKKMFDDLEHWMTYHLSNLYPDGKRPVELAKQHLEEAYMWIGKAIRDQQLNREINYKERYEK